MNKYLKKLILLLSLIPGLAFAQVINPTGITVQNNGTPLPGIANVLNFIGASATGTGSTKTITITGGGSPSAPTNSVQYNNAGSFFGDADFTRDPTTHETFIGRDMNSPGQQAGWLLQENVLFGVVPFVGNAWINNTDNMQAWNGIIDSTPFGGQPGLPGMLKFAQSGDQAILLLNQNDPTGGFQWQMSVDNGNYNNTQANVGVGDTDAILQFSDNNTNYSGRFRVRGSGADITYGGPGNSVGMFFNAGDMGWGYNARKFHLPSGVPTVGQVLGVTNVSLPDVTLDWITTSGSSLTGYTTSQNTGLGIGTAPDTMGYANTFIGGSAGAALDPGSPSTYTSRNTIIGHYAAAQLLNGYDNFIGGYQSLLGRSDPVNLSVIISPDSSLSNTGSTLEGAIAIGVGSVSGLNNYAISIGTGANATGYASTAIGYGASTVGHNGSIALGWGATNTNSYQFVVGSNSGPITDMYLGYGVQNTIPIDVKIHGSEIQTGTADTAGGNMFLIPSIGTGTGQGGTLYVKSSLAGPSGATPNTPNSWASFGPGLSALGDIDGIIGNTQLITDAANKVVRINGLGGINGDFIALFDNANRIVKLGDVSSDFQSTTLTVDDPNAAIIQDGKQVGRVDNFGYGTNITVGQNTRFHTIMFGGGSGACNVDISDTNILVGTELIVVDIGGAANVNNITIDSGTGNQILNQSISAQTLIMSNQGQVVVIKKVTSNTWVVISSY